MPAALALLMLLMMLWLVADEHLPGSRCLPMPDVLIILSALLVVFIAELESRRVSRK